MPDPGVEPPNESLTCPTCRGSGIQSTYWGEIVHGNWGRLKVDAEHFLDVPPGGTFYGGSSHHQCRSCKGTGDA